MSVEGETTEKTYTIECHRVWTIKVSASTRREALELAAAEMAEEADAEDYSYFVVKRG